MKIQHIFSFLRTASLCLVIVFAGQSCGNSNDTRQYPQSPSYASSTEAAYEDPCQSVSQKSLALFNRNLPSMIGLVQKMDQGYDPSALEVFSTLSFAVQASNYEEQMKKECPETFAVYENERNALLAFHGLAALAQYFVTSK